ncbi:MAG: OadG family protein [Anaerolineae bacterium]|nr:OadG family protein [Anaerolineae bacterium]
MENLTTALLITLIGMGLVFGAIVLFWGFMTVLVKLAAEQGDREEVEVEAARTEALSAARFAASEAELRRRAALSAAVAALAEQEAASVKPFPLPPTAFVSSWQAVMRARQLGERGRAR